MTKGADLMTETKIFFACDVHGSELVWRKFLGAANFHRVDTLIMSGDLTGKGIVPLIDAGDGVHTCTFRDKHYTLRSQQEVENMCDTVRTHGLYPYVCTRADVDELKADKKKVDTLFEDLMVDGIRRWLKMVEEKADPKIRVVINPGNDDLYAIDDVIRSFDRVIYPLEKVVDFDAYQMISCEWSNPTPWDSPRECPEEELHRKLEKEFDRVDDYSKLICNFHVPPYDTNIDEAPEVDEKFNIKKGFLGIPKLGHVGSRAIREILEEKQPPLGLHGHIHESDGEDRIGKTTCLNPGSEYTRGVLRAYLVTLSESGIKYAKISSG
jgi:Icc-related predicted phosphoesterase